MQTTSKSETLHEKSWPCLVLTCKSTTLCLLHRAHMPPACSPESRGMNGYPEETVYPSRTIAYQAAGMITSIIEALQMHDQLRYTPAFMFVLFSRISRVRLTFLAVYTRSFRRSLCTYIRCAARTRPLCPQHSNVLRRV